MQTLAPLSIDDTTNSISALMGGTAGTLCAGNDNRFFEYRTMNVRKSPGYGEYSKVVDAIAAILAIGDATESNRYLIHVDSGTFSEPLLTLPDYTCLEGADVNNTIIQHDNIGTHHVLSMGNQGYLKDLTIVGSTAVDSIGVEYTGMNHAGVAPSDDAWMQMDHVNIKQCMYCIHVDALNACETYVESVECYGPYVQAILQDGTHFSDPPTNTLPIQNYVNMTNVYIFSDDYVGRAADLHVTGAGSFLRYLVGGIANTIRSDLFDEVPSLVIELYGRAQFQTMYVAAVGALLNIPGGNGIVLQSGAQIMGTGVLLLQMKNGITVPDVGDSPFLDVDIMTASSSTMCVNILHPLARGNLKGNTKMSKTYMVDTNVSLALNMYDNDVNASRFMANSVLCGGTSFSSKVDIIKYAYNQDVGLMTGGLISVVSGITIHITAGTGYVSTQGDTLVQEISFLAADLPLPSSNREYSITVNNAGVISSSISFPYVVDTTTIRLGTVVTGTNEIVSICNVTPNIKHKHRGMSVEHLIQSTIGTLVLSGINTSVNLDVLHIGSGYYTEGTAVHQIAGAVIPTGSYRYVYLDASMAWVYSVIQNGTITSDLYNLPAGGTAAIPAGDYAKHAVFVSGDMNDATESYYVVLGKQTDPLINVIQSASADNLIPEWMSKYALRVCDILVQQGGTPTLNSILITQPNMKINKWNAGAGSSTGGYATNDHSLLTNLLNDDHPQYLRTDGTRTWTGAANAGGFAITNAGAINSVVVEAHASRHTPNQADALALGTAFCSSTVSSSSNSSRGVGLSYALSDHSHTLDATGVGINTLTGTLSILKGGTGLTSFTASRFVSSDASGNLVTPLSLDIDGAMVANSDTNVPSQKAVVTYVAAKAPTYSSPLLIASNVVKIQNSASADVTSVSIDGTFTANSDTVIPTQKATKSYITSVAPSYASPINITAGVVQLLNSDVAQVTAISTDGTMVGNSDTLVSTQKAIRTYISSVAPTYSSPVYISAGVVQLKNNNGDQVTAISNDGTYTADSDTLVPTQKATKTYMASYVASVAHTYNSPLSLSVLAVSLVNSAAATVTSISTDGTFTANSDTVVATQKATKTYVASYVSSALPTYSSPVYLVSNVVYLQNSAAGTITSISIDGTFNLNSDLLIPTQKAVKTYFASALPTYSAPVTVASNVVKLVNDAAAQVTAISTDGTFASNLDTLVSTQKATKTYIASVAHTYDAPLLLTSLAVGLVNSAAVAVTSISTDGTFASNLDTIIPTQKATKTYVASYVTSALPTYSSPVYLVSNVVRLQNSAGTQITSISIDGTMASNSDALVPTQKSVRTYVASALPTYTSPIVVTSNVVALKNSAAATITSVSTDGTMAGNSDVIVPTQKAVVTYVAASLPTYTSPIVVTSSVVALKNSASTTITSVSTDGTFASNSDVIIPTQKAVKTYVTSVVPTYTSPLVNTSNVVALKNSASTTITSVSTDGTMASNSDVIIPTQKAVVTYVAAEIPTLPTYTSPIVVTSDVVSLVNSAAATVTSVSTDGTFASNSDVIIPTQKAAKTYVTSVIPTVVGTTNRITVTLSGTQYTISAPQNLTTTSNVTFNTVNCSRLSGSYVTLSPIIAVADTQLSTTDTNSIIITSSCTVFLPDVTTVSLGRVFTIQNVCGSSANVATYGGTATTALANLRLMLVSVRNDSQLAWVYTVLTLSVLTQ